MKSVFDIDCVWLFFKGSVWITGEAEWFDKKKKEYAFASSTQIDQWLAYYLQKCKHVYIYA